MQVARTLMQAEHPLVITSYLGRKPEAVQALEALARELQRVINISRLQSAYRVRLAPDGGGLQWLGADDEKALVAAIEDFKKNGAY